MNMNNALYRDNPPFVNFDLYHRRNSLNKGDLERLLSQLRRYRNEYRLAGSRTVQNTIKNLESNLVRKSTAGSRAITRENLIKGRSRLRRVPVTKTYRRAPFSASNLQKAKAKLRHSRANSPAKKLANISLRKIIQTGRGGNVPWHVVPSGSIRRAMTSPKITRTNVRTGRTNLNTVRNFKTYVNLVKNSHEYFSRLNNENENNLNRILQNSLGFYRNKYGLTPEQDQRLYSAVLKIVKTPKPGMSTFLTKMREKYLKKGFLNAKDVSSLLTKLKGRS